MAASGEKHARGRAPGRPGEPLGSWALWLLPFAWMALIFVASQTPAKDIPSIWFLRFAESDKVAHGLLYFVLCLTFYVPLSRRGLRRRPAVAAWVAAVLSVLYGISDELHQLAVPGRTPSWYDLGADCVGALLAALLANRWPGRNR